MGRYKMWIFLKSNTKLCSGIIVRKICIFGVADLAKMISSGKLFANKFHLDVDPLALDCLEQYIRNRSLNQKHDVIERSFYENLPFVKAAFRQV